MAVGGRPPTSRQRLLARSRDELAPHISLGAVATTADRIVTATSVTATLVSALGLVSALELADVSFAWALPSVVLGAVSVVCAVWATVPALDTIRPGDLEDVDRFFTRQLRIRGGLVRAAALTLGLAVLATPLPALAAALTQKRTELAFTATREARTVAVTATARELPDGARLTIEVERLRSPPLVIARAEAGPGAVLRVAAHLTDRDLREVMRLRGQVRHEGRVVAERGLRLPSW